MPGTADQLVFPRVTETNAGAAVFLWVAHRSVLHAAGSEISVVQIFPIVTTDLSAERAAAWTLAAYRCLRRNRRIVIDCAETMQLPKNAMMK